MGEGQGQISHSVLGTTPFLDADTLPLGELTVLGRSQILRNPGGFPAGSPDMTASQH